MSKKRLAWWAVIVAGVALGVAVVIVFGAGMQPAPPSDDEVVPPIGALVAIHTAEPAPPNSPCNDALIQGELVADARFGLAIRTRSGVAATLWPQGYFGRVSADGIQLVAADGRIIGQTGDRISAGGGTHQIDGLDGRLCLLEHRGCAGSTLTQVRCPSVDNPLASAGRRDRVDRRQSRFDLSVDPSIKG